MPNELRRIQQLYNDNVNIIDYLKNESNFHENTSEMITISYDLQAGSYIKKASEDPDWEDEFSQEYANVSNSLGDFNSILEVGVGEATTLQNVLSRLSSVTNNVFGFDISYSRKK